MTLRYAPFAASVEMQAAAANQRPFHLTSRGRGVALLQSGFVQLGFKMAKSIHGGMPDGIFGSETLATTKAFQAKEKLHPDGVAGRDTVSRLDDLLFQASPPPPPPPPAPPPPMSKTYMLGTSDPPLRHDSGAGVWNSRPKELAYIALKVEMLDKLPFAAIAVGDDAAKHLAHYLANSGLDYTIDLDGMVSEVPSAKEGYETEVAQMQGFVQQLPVGSHFVTSRQLEQLYCEQEDNRNWFFAIGGYSAWGKGLVKVQETGGIRTYEVDFTYKFNDRYNWDAGKSVKLAGITITDKFMGEFHRQGLAKEFNCLGSFARRFAWKQGDPIAGSQLHPPKGRTG